MSLSAYYLAQRISYLQSELNAIIDGTGGSGIPTTSNLATVLTNGNSAGTQNIDLSNNDILQVDNINLTTINGFPYPPSSGMTSYLPILITSGGGEATYASRSGVVSRIGNVVCFQMEITISGLGTLNPALSLVIQLPPGLPNNSTLQVLFQTGVTNNVIGGFAILDAIAGPGSGVMTLNRKTTSGAGYSAVLAGQISSNFSISLSGVYMTQ